MTKEEAKKIKRRFQGAVISDKMDKTVVVKVDRVKIHPKYHKRYTVSKNYKAHDEKNIYKTGDWVEIQACRPLSRDKRWRVIGRAGKSILTARAEQEELGRVAEADEEVVHPEKEKKNDVIGEVIAKEE